MVSSLNKMFSIKVEECKPRWIVIDAKGQVLGRLATKVAAALRGKDKTVFTPHQDAGDYVVVTNCDKIVLTGDKMENKLYYSHSGYKGSLSKTPAKEVMQKFPRRVFELAVKGMLPKTKLGNQIFKKLKVYAGPAHPHEGQVKAGQ